MQNSFELPISLQIYSKEFSKQMYIDEIHSWRNFLSPIFCLSYDENSLHINLCHFLTFVRLLFCRVIWKCVLHLAHSYVPRKLCLDLFCSKDAFMFLERWEKGYIFLKKKPCLLLSTWEKKEKDKNVKRNPNFHLRKMTSIFTQIDFFHIYTTILFKWWSIIKHWIQKIEFQRKKK